MLPGPVLALALLSVSAEPDRAAPKEREFLFTYRATVTGLKPGQTARVWLPVPPTNEDQSVAIVRKDLPAPARLERGRVLPVS